MKKIVYLSNQTGPTGIQTKGGDCLHKTSCSYALFNFILIQRRFILQNYLRIHNYKLFTLYVSISLFFDLIFCRIIQLNGASMFQTSTPSGCNFGPGATGPLCSVQDLMPLLYTNEGTGPVGTKCPFVCKFALFWLIILSFAIAYK